MTHVSGQSRKNILAVVCLDGYKLLPTHYTPERENVHISQVEERRLRWIEWKSLTAWIYSAQISSSLVHSGAGSSSVTGWWDQSVLSTCCPECWGLRVHQRNRFNMKYIWLHKSFTAWLTMAICRIGTEESKMAVWALDGQRIQLKVKALEFTIESFADLCWKATALRWKVQGLPWKFGGTGDECPKAFQTSLPNKVCLPNKQRADFLPLPFYSIQAISLLAGAPHPLFLKIHKT